MALTHLGPTRLDIEASDQRFSSNVHSLRRSSLVVLAVGWALLKVLSEPSLWRQHFCLALADLARLAAGAWILVALFLYTPICLVFLSFACLTFLAADACASALLADMNQHGLVSGSTLRGVPINRVVI